MKPPLRLLRKTISLIRRSAPGWATANVFLSLLGSFLPLALIWFVKGLIDAVTLATNELSSENTRAALFMILAIAIIYFLDESVQSITKLVRKKQSFYLESFMYDLLHKKSISSDLSHFENPEYYDTLSRAAREAPYRPASIVNNLVSLLRGLISLILVAGLLSLLSWWLIIILLAANFPGILLRVHFSDVLYNFKKKLTPVARKAAYFNWLLTGDRPSRELRLFGLGKYFSSLFKKNFNKQKEEEISIVRKRSFIELFSGLFKAAATLAVLYYIVIQTTMANISLGELAMYLLAFRLGMTCIKQLLGSMAGLYEDNLFIHDIFEFLNLRTSVIAVPPIVKAKKFDNNIRIENVSFSYPGSQKYALKNIDLKINKGEILALVGSNGAGKTTFARLLCRLYDPVAGKILMDGNDIRNIEPDDYRRLFSVVFQDFMLYNLSAGDNIRAGNIHNNKNMDLIKDSATRTGIHNLINELPKGYDTVIGRLFDDSRELSWGEWQKIALARALYRQSDILILDEPGSALDAESEYELFTRFKEIIAGRSCILISHTLSNVSLADRIAVLDKGSIIEIGTHNELMQNKGKYFDMYSKQKSRYL